MTKDSIQSFLVSRPELSYSTTKHLKILINQVLEKALDDGLISRNPAAVNFAIPGKSGKRNALSANDIRDVISHVSELDFADRIFILIPVYAGLHRGEMLGLKWSDIDFDNKLIHMAVLWRR